MRMFDPRSLTPVRASARERLDRLARFLDTVAEDALTFSRWHGLGKGCAVGLAIVRDPWFRAQGLRLSAVERFGDCGPVYGASTDWAAVCAFFDLEQDEATALLTAAGYDQRLRPAPREVAAKIRAFLRKKYEASPSGSHSHSDIAVALT